MIVRRSIPAIERAILRCLDPDPARRPVVGARGVGALPGGDPLAAALAAGETPSPEMVAAAGGETRVMPVRHGVAWLVAIVVLALGLGTVAAWTTIAARVPLGKPVDVLIDRAQQDLQSFGYTDPIADSASGFTYDADLLNWAADHGAGSTHWSILTEGRPSVLQFWRRTSPQSLMPIDPEAYVTAGDPPQTVSGMTLLRLDPQGRLLSFHAVTPQVDASAPVAAAALNWTPFFEAASLDPAGFHEVASQWTPNVFADERKAWEGVLPVASAPPVRIEAAAYRGRAVMFEVVGAWTRPSRQQAFQVAATGQMTSLIGAVLVVALLLGSALIAHRNVRSGRADRRGAFVLGAFVFTMMVAGWLLQPHVSDFGSETDRMFAMVAQALFQGGLLFVLYLALEPAVRRSMPDMLITWTRVVSGRLRDPRVGRDLLIGLAAAALMEYSKVLYAWLPTVLGHPEPLPGVSSAVVLSGSRLLASELFRNVVWSLQTSLLFVLMIGLFSQWLKRRWLAYAVTILLITVLSHRQNDVSTGYVWLDFAFTAVTSAITIAFLMRTGLFTASIFFYAQRIADAFMPTFASTSSFAQASWVVFALIVAFGLAGYVLATRKPPATGVLRPAY